VLTNDDQIARKLRMIRNQGMGAQYHHEVVGYNFRMTDLAAAIGCIQLKRLPGWTDIRIANADFFSRSLTSVQVPNPPSTVTHVYHQYTVRVPAKVGRDQVLARLNQRGIGARVYYATPIHQQPVFQARPNYQGLHLPETERAAREVLSLPVHPGLSAQERDQIVEEVNAAC